jgi:hypothetical protein
MLDRVSKLPLEGYADYRNTFNSSMRTAMGYSSSVLSGPSDILEV